LGYSLVFYCFFGQHNIPSLFSCIDCWTPSYFLFSLVDNSKKPNKCGKWRSFKKFLH
jgi:hypothetical protein